MRLVTPADTYVYEYGWSPDGRQIALTYAKGNGDDNWWIARLARVEVATGAMHDLLAPAFQIADPQWSPDGKPDRDHRRHHERFRIRPAATSISLTHAAANRATSRDGAPISVQSLRWNDASSIDLVAHVSGSMHLMRLERRRRQTSLTTLSTGAESLWSWSSAKGGAIVALVRASFDRSAGGLGGSAVGACARSRRAATPARQRSTVRPYR